MERRERERRARADRREVTRAEADLRQMERRTSIDLYQSWMR